MGKLLEDYYAYRECSEVSEEKRIVFSIIQDLSDRRGLRQEWDEIDNEIKEEIIQKWIDIAKPILKETKEEIVADKIYYPHCNELIDINALLKKYGPEGLYEIADKFKEAANEDVRQALEQCDEPCRPKLPTTLSEAVEFFTPAFNGMEKEFERDIDDFAAFCHSQLSGGIGGQIRNALNLWDANSIMHQHMKTVEGYCHPEDMSDKILREIYKNVNFKNQS